MEEAVEDVRRRTERLVFRVRPSERTRIERAALGTGKYVAEFIRDTCLTEADNRLAHVGNGCGLRDNGE